ncbi:MAG: hypothetical protein ACLFP8_02890 [Alphaproteobacteria bacterium]
MLRSLVMLSMATVVSIVFSATVLVILLATKANADEYGQRFHNETPPGMAEYTVPETPEIAMDDKAEDLQDIMPAAGDKEESQENTTSEEKPAQEPAED